MIKMLWILSQVVLILDRLSSILPGRVDMTLNVSISSFYNHVF